MTEKSPENGGVFHLKHVSVRETSGVTYPASALGQDG